jgi:hypothetical protein
MSQFVFSVYKTVNNRLKKKPLFSSGKYRESLKFFKEEIDQNNKNVLYHLRYKSNVVDVTLERYFLVLVKEHKNGHKEIVKQEEYLIEEKFYVYGLKKRLTVVELFEEIIPQFSEYFTTVRMFKNKIVFESGDKIECILTKNLYECKRLYTYLNSAFKARKISAFLFLGKVPDTPTEIKRDLIERLVDLTGLSHFQFRRNKTRH